MSLVSISRKLSKNVNAVVADLKPEDCGGAAYIYNPLDYARAPHEKYLKEYGRGSKEVLLLGMNPGPFGMAQTGVPFGDIKMVTEFLKVTGRVGAPPEQHPKRLITGFACSRSEVSGTRLWGFAQDRFQSAERFFQRFFVANYCPLVFMEESGRNLTPDKLPQALRQELFSVCNEAVRELVSELKPEWVLGVGGFAQKRAQEALSGINVKVATILHPSPASPAANRGWSAAVEKQLSALGIAI